MPSRTATPASNSKPPGGVLPISAVTDKSAEKAAGLLKDTSEKTLGSRLKVVLRRLPPGLTETELYSALGEEWRPGKGKITWVSYRKGKPSKDLSKPSRPARAYFYVTDQSQLDALSQSIAQADFTDARGLANDTALIGPPALEFAPYGRIPSGKRRHDARQGTIDQDPEFIEFLESLTNPITKPKALDIADGQKDQPITVTPLIQHLRDKKAARDKAASMKAAAKQQKQDGKVDTASSSTVTEATSSAKDAPTEKKPALAPKGGEKVSKDTVRSPPRKEKTAPSPRSQAASAAKGSPANARTDATSKRPDGPSAGSAAARMIQRDLGIRSVGRGGSARPLRGDNQSPDSRKTTPVKTTTDTAANAAKSSPASVPVANNPISKPPHLAPSSAVATASQHHTSHAVKQPLTSTKPPTGPKATPIAPARPTKSSAVDPNATRAFLKHANPSQGVTEALLDAALSVHGKLTRVEIDKRKGFAYVEFANPAGLQAAIAASPIAVAQGSVQVLERKDRGGAASAAPTAPAAIAHQGPPLRGGRGGIGPGFRGGARGGRGRGAALGGRGDSAVSSMKTSAPNGIATASAGTNPTPTATVANTKVDVP